MATRLMCGNTHRYRALKPPTCGCTRCEKKWEQAEQSRNARPLVRRRVAGQTMDPKALKFGPF